MSDTTNALRPEDYEEPACLLCGEPYGAEPKPEPVPQQRIIQKLDAYMSRRDYAGAERHLRYWLEEARRVRDLRGQLLVCNELIGHYRKVGDRENALAMADEALRLLKVLDFEDAVSGGTTYVNAATACSAFGDHERALALFEKARAVYESNPGTRPHLLGGLYNNMALACQALGRYDEAFALYDKAMELMGQVRGGALEQAITCLNRANAVEDEFGLEDGESRIFDLLDQASDLLDDPAAPRDGYYAFVCEKCAPTLEYYGYFDDARRLKEEAERIYAGA